MPIAILTDTVVRSLSPSPKAYIVWDERLTGFGVRVLPSGRRTFLVRYRPGGGGRRAPDRKLSLGDCSLMSSSRARDLARKALAKVVQGGDPSAERIQGRKADTFGAFADRYLENHAVPRKKPRSVAEDRRQTGLAPGDRRPHR